MASMLYAPVEVRAWRELQPEAGRWERSEWRSRGRARRSLIVLLFGSEAWKEEAPDWLRMAQEVAIELAIGGSLLVVLRPGKSTQQ
jgi:hypothetical protein